MRRTHRIVDILDFMNDLVTEERVMIAASVLSALATLAAVWFAYKAAAETRALRREDRLARLPELVAEFGEFAINAGQPTPRYAIRRARVAAMLGSLHDPLPACRVIACGEDFVDATKLGENTIGAVTVVALNELADTIRADAK